tara:strand:- start:48 stop:260 length:213 start_codon:yes stop_codon:yes gene_type:complete
LADETKGLADETIGLEDETKCLAGGTNRLAERSTLPTGQTPRVRLTISGAAHCAHRDFAASVAREGCGGF